MFVSLLRVNLIAGDRNHERLSEIGVEFSGNSLFAWSVSYSPHFSRWWNLGVLLFENISQQESLIHFSNLHDSGHPWTALALSLCGIIRFDMVVSHYLACRSDYRQGKPSSALLNFRESLSLSVTFFDLYNVSVIYKSEGKHDARVKILKFLLEVTIYPFQLIRNFFWSSSFDFLEILRVGFTAFLSHLTSPTLHFC